APHCLLNTAAALPIHVTTDKLHMLVSLLFSGMMLPGDFQEVHVLYSREIVNRHSDKKQYFEIMSFRVMFWVLPHPFFPAYHLMYGPNHSPIGLFPLVFCSEQYAI